MIQTLFDALAERGYDTLTPVQEAVTDPALDAADLLVSAQTGSGKTVGFGLAIGSTLLNENGTFEPAAAPLALIVAPTRELAFQVTRELDWLYSKAGARVVSCVGGMDMRDERRALDRGAHIVVGTPGRLKDHIQRNSLEMGSLRAVVLDEADEMLDLGFREDLEFMLGEAPATRRTLMFSATVPPAIATLAKRYQRDAVRVTTVSERSQHADITYQALRVAQQDAENAIINVLRYHDAQNAIVFANTRATVNRLTARFANRGFAVVSLSGELSQTERSHALQAMRDGRARVCVATDVAARGIDLPNLELVIHAELPSNAEGLLHRSGRTGRAGRKGTSALVVPPKALKRAERLLQSARITAEWTTAPGAEDILRRDEDRLLSAPSWSDEITENEAAFAERLLAEHDPLKVAAAYLRLYRAQHSAPEELSAPDARPAAKERTPFGESAWIAVSVGRDDRAEPRWILPLLCRSGGLDKEAIGAIRVQQTETFVEISAPRMDEFLSALGPDAVLEKGVTVRRIDGPQDSAPAPRPAPAQRSAPVARPAPSTAAPEAKDHAKPRDADAPPKKAYAPDRAPAKDAPSKPYSARPKSGGSDKKPAWKKDDRSPGLVTKRREKPGEGPRKAPAGKHKAGGGSSSRGAAASDTSKRFTPPGGSTRPKSGGGGSGANSKPGGPRPPKRHKG